MSRGLPPTLVAEGLVLTGRRRTEDKASSRNAVMGREVFQRFSQETLNTPQRPSFLDMYSSPGT